jgi:hypothetical protein
VHRAQLQSPQDQQVEGASEEFEREFLHRYRNPISTAYTTAAPYLHDFGVRVVGYTEAIRFDPGHRLDDRYSVTC